MPPKERAGTEAPSSGGAPRPLLTVEDLASYLSLSARGAREILQRGELPGFRIGRRWFVRTQDLDAAVAEKVASHRRDRDAAVRLLRGLPAAERAKESP